MWLANQELTGVRIPQRVDGMPWWKAESQITLYFNQHTTSDERAVLAETCGSCGKCCTNLPAHQIAIYMTDYEVTKAMGAGHNMTDGLHKKQVMVDGNFFYVLKTKDNGDCFFLGEKGCTLGDEKPLWCKAYYCEKLYGGEYPFEHVVPVSQIGIRKA